VARRHYVKVLMEKVSGATNANADLANLGYIVHCRVCNNHFTIQQDELKGTTSCKLCNSPRIDYGGPLWIGMLQNQAYCKKLLETAPDFQYLHTKREAYKILSLSMEDNGMPPGSQDIHEIAHAIKAPVMPVVAVLDRLHELGYSGVRDAFNPTAIKTSAPIEATTSILKANA
nr:hypothetical protein [Candidatus Sigynarchaeota archaeon]